MFWRMERGVELVSAKLEMRRRFKRREWHAINKSLLSDRGEQDTAKQQEQLAAGASKES
jgi:hypothetical protein